MTDRSDSTATCNAPVEPGASPETPPTLEALAGAIHRGSKLLRDHDPLGARELLEPTARQFPRNPAVRHLLAFTSFQLGDFERARALYETLLLACPHDTPAKVNLAVVLLKLGVAAEARPLLEGVVREEPGHRRAWGYLGVALEQLGFIAEAESALVAGRFVGAAKRLHDRHPESFVSGATLPDARRNGSDVVPMPPRRTLAVGERSSARPATTGNVGHIARPRFTATLRPSASSASEPSLTRSPDDPACDGPEIAFEQTVARLPAVPPPAMSHAPRPNRPAIPLLDAALSSLLVVPHEATVVAHETGLVLVGLVQSADASDGGFAARADVVHAFSGALERAPLPRRPPPIPAPFRDKPFLHITGTGQLVLAPPSGTRLLPLEMDADVAFVREEMIVAFDHSLLYDHGRLDRPSGPALSLVRFRGDGEIVLGLDRTFLAFDVRGEELLALRADALIGWIGLLAPETLPGEDDLIGFTGEGTVLFRAPRET